MSDQETIQSQLEILTAHRRTLSHYLRQQALVGLAHVKPEIDHGINEARDQIRRIKAVLRRAVTTRIHEALERRELLPSIHLADTGYIYAELLLESERQYQIDLLGPVRGDYRRQSQAGAGFASADFVIDWQAKQATWPAGRTRSSFRQSHQRGDQDQILDA